MVGLEKSSGANGAGGVTGLAVPIPLGARSALVIVAFVELELARGACHTDAIVVRGLLGDAPSAVALGIKSSVSQKWPTS